MLVAMTRSNGSSVEALGHDVEALGVEGAGGGRADAHGSAQVPLEGRSGGRRRIRGGDGAAQAGEILAVLRRQGHGLAVANLAHEVQHGRRVVRAPQVRDHARVDVGSDHLQVAEPGEPVRDERVHHRPGLVALRRARLQEPRARREIQPGADDEDAANTAVRIERLQDAQAEGDEEPSLDGGVGAEAARCDRARPRRPPVGPNAARRTPSRRRTASRAGTRG